MTAFRFRVKYDPDPTTLWRDVVVGNDRTLEELQATINSTMGLDQGHLWFFAAGEDYWDTDVEFQCPQEFRDVSDDSLVEVGRDTHDAGEATVGDVVDRLDIAERDRFCYLYDYGEEWRFYAICKEVLGDAPDRRPPEVVETKGDPVEQHGR